MRQFLKYLPITFLLFSCKKNDTPVCETNMASMAGSYHLTKFERVAFSTGIPQDVTGTLSSCELSAVYNLNPDSTATYSEGGSCTGSGSGNWQYSTNFIFSFKSGNGVRLNTAFFYSWNCTNLVVMTAYPSTVSNDRYTLTRF